MYYVPLNLQYAWERCHAEPMVKNVVAKPRADTPELFFTNMRDKFMVECWPLKLLHRYVLFCNCGTYLVLIWRN